MGRVKRYKKVKAMDPFAKHSTGAKKGFGSRKSDDLDRNLPPDVKNHEAQRLNNLHGDGSKMKKKKRQLPQWAHEELKETAKRVREEHADPNGKARQVQPERSAMEGKRDDESMRQFNRRVREGTARLLRDEFKEHSSTNKRKKKYLDDKKRKTKLKKQGLWEEFKRRERLDEEEGGGGEEGDADGGRGGGKARAKATKGGGRRGSSAGGGEGEWKSLGRADDEEGTHFPGKERIRFGEVAHAPPDLAKIPKPRGFRDQGQSKSWARHNGGGRSGDNDDEGRQQSGRKRGGGGASGGGGVAVAEEEKEEEEDAAERRKAQNRQMEEMRKRVQEAYSGLKKKRRAGQTQFVGSDL